MNSLRQNLSDLLSTLPVSRKPALRRSSEAGFLYATDLPLCASEEICLRFESFARAQGWQCFTQSHWIFLSPEFPACPALPEDGEGACLSSLLSRHPEFSLSKEEIISLLKAEEEGPASLNSACAAIHASLAVRLRKKCY